MDTGMLFLGEIMVYAVVAGVLGYMIGTGAFVLLYAGGLAPEGFRPNYSSLYTITSVGISIGIMLVASIYPFIKASKLVTPSLERKWKITSKPIGTKWEIPLPLKVRREEYIPTLKYLNEYLSLQKVKGRESFLTTESNIVEKTTDRGKENVLSAVLNIGGELSTSLEVRGLEKAGEEGVLYLGLEFGRISGTLGQWKKTVPGLANSLRKQILTWTGLPSGAKARYMDKGESQK
jgi:hypothetical protein